MPLLSLASLTVGSMIISGFFFLMIVLLVTYLEIRK
jgi:hypothetical protein